MTCVADPAGLNGTRELLLIQVQDNASAIHDVAGAADVAIGALWLLKSWPAPRYSSCCCKRGTSVCGVARQCAVHRRYLIADMPMLRGGYAPAPPAKPTCSLQPARTWT